jgi:hypothetical protein
MKKQREELDVDFIGTQQSALTKKAEMAISEFIRTRKAKKKKSTSKAKVKA